MSTKASIVIQDLTYTEKQLGLGVTITYQNGGTAGSELVTVSGHAVTVTIQSGVSTATQIKAAVDGSTDASALVSVTVSGTGSNTQVSCVLATLSGATAAAAASLKVGSLTYTAKVAGTAGNSIRIRYTAGATAGSEAVTVSTNDISVQIADNVSTAAQIKTAVAASTGANALVAVTSAGADLSVVQTVGMAGAYTNLANGTALTHSSKVVQDLTFTSVATGTAANGITVTYATGATAGSEVVSVSGTDISVQIQNGTSTATQVKAALDGSTAAAALITTTISGTGSNAQKTVNALATAGAVGDGERAFYKDNGVAALTASFVVANFGFNAKVCTITNDDASGSNLVVGSYDGVNIHFELKAGEALIVDGGNFDAVWLKYSGGAAAYRVMAKGC